MNNESVTWQRKQPYVLRTTSKHIDRLTGRQTHFLDTGWSYTWRSAAVHWGEGVGLGAWGVYGQHFIQNQQTRRIYLLQKEYVTSCSIYDGWWD